MLVQTDRPLGVVEVNKISNSTEGNDFKHIFKVLGLNP